MVMGTRRPRSLTPIKRLSKDVTVRNGQECPTWEIMSESSEEDGVKNIF